MKPKNEHPAGALDKLRAEDTELADLMESGPMIAEATTAQIIGMAGSKQFHRLGHYHPPDATRKAASAKGGFSEVVVRPASCTPASDTRQEHLEAVTAAINAIAGANLNRIEAYIAAGESLANARAAGSRGTWGAWLRQNFSLSADTAERAINLWINRDAVREFSARVRNVSLRQVIEFLAQQRKPEALPSPAQQRPKPPSKTELVKRIESLQVQLKAKSDALDDALAKGDAEPAIAVKSTTNPADVPAPVPAPYIPPPPAISLLPQPIEPVETEVTEQQRTAQDAKMEALYGPLDGWEWLALWESCTHYGKRDCAEFEKLVAHFNVPLAELAE